MNREIALIPQKKKLSIRKTHMTAIKEEGASVIRYRGRIVKTAKELYDDIVLASHDPKELHTMLKELNREGKTVEIEINLKKTQVMFNEQINGEMEVKIDQTRLHISRATNHHPAK